MNILIAHSFYQRPGGEDKSFRTSIATLEKLGHRVVPYTVDNATIDEMPKLRLLSKTLWNTDAAREVHDLCKRERIDVAIFHNTFPLISPAAYGAAKAAGAKVVQWLHNYRLLCPAATFLRDGKICEDCLPKTIPIDAVLHRCYRNSRSASAVSAALIGVHKVKGTWRDDIDRFMALTEFARKKFIGGGLPADKVRVIPNFINDDPGVGAGDGGYAIFVGRLSPEKGIKTLLAAWQTIDMPLKIVGDGPMRAEVDAAALRLPHVEIRGWCDEAATMDLLKRAKLMVIPSIWYEGGLPYSAIESFATGTPVMATDIGGFPEHIDGRNGRLFRLGDAHDLAETAFLMRDVAHTMRAASRASYAQFTAAESERHFTALLDGLFHA